MVEQHSTLTNVSNTPAALSGRSKTGLTKHLLRLFEEASNALSHSPRDRHGYFSLPELKRLHRGFVVRSRSRPFAERDSCLDALADGVYTAGNLAVLFEDASLKLVLELVHGDRPVAVFGASVE